MGIKGLRPPAGTGLAAFENIIARERPDLFTGPFSWPLMTLDEAALEHNMTTMADYCTRNGFEFAPHIKTHMSARLWQGQHRAGACGATVATGEQLRTARAWGTQRLLLANQLLDGRELAWLAEQARRATDDLQVWLYADSRTGVRSHEEAIELARAADTAGLRVVGVSGYEGSVAKGESPEALAAVQDFCADLLVTAEALVPVTGERPVLSVGGSAFLDVVERALGPATDRVRVVVRSGSYLTHDHGMYTRADPWSRMSGTPGLQPALRLWAQVHSVPEPGLVLCGAGRRDAPFDSDLPIPLRVHPAGGQGPARQISGETTRLNDQHLFLRTTEEVAVGEVIEFGISHPCTSFDKWHTLPLLQGHQVTGLVHTEF